MKICIKCGLNKNENEFYFRKDISSYRNECQKCFIENRKQYNKEYSNKNKGQLKQYRKRYNKENGQHKKQYAKQYHKNNIKKIMLLSAKKRAEKKGIDFNIAVEDITIPEFCPVLGIPLFVGDGKFQHNSPSLDRLDNTKGYIKNNIIVVSWRANSLKNDSTIEELEKLYSGYKKILSGKGVV